MQYYLFIDECGHHNLDKIDPIFPCFAVCGILVSKFNYLDIEQRIDAIKSKFWGDKKVILRSYNIRNGKKEFSIFIDNPGGFDDFVNNINSLVTDSKFKIICPVIHKQEHKDRYKGKAHGAYEIAISFLLQRCIYCLSKVYTRTPKKLNIILEKRSPELDAKIENHISALMTFGDKYISSQDYSQYGHSVEFANKYQDYAGLQIADLMAYPILTKSQ